MPSFSLKSADPTSSQEFDATDLDTAVETLHRFYDGRWLELWSEGQLMCHLPHGAAELMRCVVASLH